MLIGKDFSSNCFFLPACPPRRSTHLQQASPLPLWVEPRDSSSSAQCRRTPPTLWEPAVRGVTQPRVTVLNVAALSVTELAVHRRGEALLDVPVLDVTECAAGGV